MAKQYNPVGSGADFWRSDNPLICTWYRFGDTPEAKDSVTFNRLSAENFTPTDTNINSVLVDSSMSRGQLVFGRFVTNDSWLTTALSPFPNRSGSGLLFAGSNANNIRVLATDWNRTRPSTNFGPYGDPLMTYSGITVMGWVQFGNAPIGGEGTDRQIWGWNDYRTYGGARFSWGIDWNEQYGRIRAKMHFASNETIYVNNTTTPVYPLPVGEPVFFAMQLAYTDRDYSDFSNASRVMRLYIGTASSGVTLEEEVSLSAIAGIGSVDPGSDGDDTYCIGNDASAVNTNLARPNYLPQDTIIDDFVIVSEGNLSIDQLNYFKDNGIEYIDTSCQTDSNFQIELPGTDDLVAYWTFEDGTGTNSSPNTSGLVPLDLQFSNPGFNYQVVEGVRGGSGLLIPGQGTNGGEYLRYDIGSASWPFLYIPAGSGYPYLFPTNDLKGMTYMMWFKDQPTTQASAVNTYVSPLVAWHNATASQFDQFIFRLEAGGGLTGASLGVIRTQLQAWGHASGTYDAARAEDVQQGCAANSSSDDDVLHGTNPQQWNFIAWVVDIEDGAIYASVNCQGLVPIFQAFSPLSGLNFTDIANDLESDVANDTAFVIGKRTLLNFTSNLQDMYVDEIAVYSRPLTLPEISGFAASGTAVQAANIFPSQFTDDPRTLAYWSLGGSGTYIDPITSGELGFIEDSSYYRHNLPIMSGQFSLDTPLNSLISDQSIKVEQSGSMLCIPRSQFGGNLDFSEPNHFNHRGFSAGAWIQIPSGTSDSSLLGPHQVMGCWGQNNGEWSWYLDIIDNKLQAAIIDASEGPNTPRIAVSDVEVLVNEPMFVGVSMTPSGAVFIMELYQGRGDAVTGSLELVDYQPALALSTSQQCSASGFSLLNAPNQQFGFPSGTQMQGAFIYSSGMSFSDMEQTKKFGIGIVGLSPDASTVLDADNISHWKFDEVGAEFRDFGTLGNPMLQANIDGIPFETVPAIHGSGVKVDKEGYLNTGPYNPDTRGLALGSGSFTILGWLAPNVVDPVSDDEFFASTAVDIDNVAGMQILSEANTSTFTGSTSDSVTVARTSGYNSRNFDRISWHHVALVHDKSGLIQNMVVNGRYAGLSVYDDFGIPYPATLSGLYLGGRGGEDGNVLTGGSAFSGILDDWMVFDKALTLSEISGLAANSFAFDDGANSIQTAALGTYVSGLLVTETSGIIAGYLRGLGQDFELSAGYISGVQGEFGHLGGYLRGKVVIDGLTGGFAHGLDTISGIFAGHLHGLGVESGVVGVYEYGACQTFNEFDITFVFNVVASEDFDAQLAVELTSFKDFDARLDVIRITQPPVCSLVWPAAQTIVSGLPYTLDVSGLAQGQNNKEISLVRFTFSDFRGAELGVLASGVADNGIYTAGRTLDTEGLYTIKVEVVDEFGYRSSCAQQILALASGSTSGSVVAGLPHVQLSATPTSGAAQRLVVFTHSLSGLSTTSGVFEYTDFADQQETQVNGLEVPSGTAFGREWTADVREHVYTMPGFYLPVWSLSGRWGVVSETLSDGIDSINF